MEFKFVEATKEQLKARVALYGLSGSGKTIAALRIARYMADLEGKNVAVIETEGRATNKYLGLQFEGESPLKFACLNMNGNHSPVNFLKAIEAAEKSGQFSAIVIDSISHAWDGTLEMADKGSWKTASPAHTALMSKILNSQCHIIATIRAEEETVTEKDGKTGKWKKVVIGTKPKSKKDIIYEFDMAGEIERGSNIFTLEKSRSFAMPVGTEYEKPGRNFAQPLYDWLQDGEVIAPPVSPHDAFMALIGAATTKDAVEALKAEFQAHKETLTAEQKQAEVLALKAAIGRVSNAA